MKSKNMHWRATDAAVENARRVLPELVRQYFQSGRGLNADSKAKAMHAFRLQTKHLRYTLEAFVPLYGPGLSGKLDSLRPIQNALGELNDCAVLLAEMEKQLTHEARAFVERRSGEKRKEFLRYWREVFDSTGEDKKWEQYLMRFAREPRQK